MNEKEIANYVYEISEDSIYGMLKAVNNNHVDQSLVYCYIKAFYLNSFKYYSEKKKSTFDFNKVYEEYKEKLKIYYTTNNPTITNMILDDVLNFFDNSFSLIQTVELNDIEDSYEFRHYTINVFELLRMILEKKSKSTIIENIFENYTKILVEYSEKLFDYIDKNKKIKKF